jgi:hypothetical protein
MLYLVTSFLAALSILFPFTWKHLLIPYPQKLLAIFVANLTIIALGAIIEALLTYSLFQTLQPSELISITAAGILSLTAQWYWWGIHNTLKPS